jgi:hypothetical protein
MAMTIFTLVHVFISLIGIGSGLVVAYGLLTGRRFDLWTVIFLTTTVATSVTGFFFPIEQLLPSHIVGILSLVVLAVCLVARYRFCLASAWRWIFVVTAMVALYFNVFVLIAQTFLKVPMFHELAPTQSEPPFLVAQLLNLLLFIGLTVPAVIKFRGKAIILSDSTGDMRTAPLRSG